jgi:hypothetical protein
MRLTPAVCVWNLSIVPVLHQLRPEAASRSEFGDFLKEVDVAVEEE